MLNWAQDVYGIVPSNIFGYESIVGNDLNLKDHPGMKLMIDYMNKKDADFEYWMLKGDLYSNPKGIMHRFLINGDRSKMTKFQLEFLLQQIEEKFQEKEKIYKDQLIECEQCNEDLSTKNEEFKTKNKELRTENEELREKYKKARIDISQLEKKTRAYEEDSGLYTLDLCQFTILIRLPVPQRMIDVLWNHAIRILVDVPTRHHAPDDLDQHGRGEQDHGYGCDEHGPASARG